MREGASLEIVLTLNDLNQNCDALRNNLMIKKFGQDKMILPVLTEYCNVAFKNLLGVYLISPVAIACFTSPINCVIGISRGQALVQLKAVRQRQTPICPLRTLRRSSAA